MKQLFITILLVFLSAFIILGQEDSLYQKNRWTVSAGCNYQFAKLPIVYGRNINNNSIYYLNYNLKNNFSPEINISLCLDRTQKYVIPICGLNITDNITRYYEEGFTSTSSTPFDTFIAENYFHQISAAPYVGMEFKFPVSKKLLLQFTLISVNRFGYYYILNKYDYVDKIRTIYQDYYFDFNVNFNLGFGFILNTKGRIKPGFMIYKPLFNSGGIFGDEFFLKNYYDQIGGGLLLNF